MMDNLDRTVMVVMGGLAIVLGEFIRQFRKKPCNVTEIEPGVRLCKTHRIKWDAPVESCPRQGEEAARW